MSGGNAGTPPKVKEPELFKTVSKNLILGGTAGIIGACCTYPLDMIKTLLQNQKTLPNGQKEFSGIVDAFGKIFKRGGFVGLYKGLPAQLVGITPEKAIKLTVNDFLRYTFTDKQTGVIALQYEALAGGVAGLSQVVATNPYELVKVRLQTQNSLEPSARKTAVQIVRELGLKGLTRGAPACLLRDVPFSVIYFTLYGRLKKFFGEKPGQKLPATTLFFCGIAAGAVASGTVTPADVIKTRLQVANSPYKGIVDCATKTMRDEGPKAFFKGIVPRLLIISPLFGITLSVYEVLQGRVDAWLASS